jgi:ABC-2 type transport system ATP-binding protein
LNLEIKRGEIFGLLGTNGAGKTTTIKMLSTLLSPSSGTALISNFDIRHHSKAIRRIIGAVFSGQMIFHQLTGRANLEFYGDLYDVPNLQQRIRELAKFFNLEDRIEHRVETYSKGMKLMLALMRGVIHDPEIIYLDEPTQGLDPNKALTMRMQVRELQKRGKTIILTTHHMAEAEDLCDRIAILNKGKIMVMDTPRGLKKRIPGRTALEVECDNAKDCSLLRKGIVLSEDKKIVMVPINDPVQVNEIIKELVQKNIKIKNIKLIEPSLERVFSYFTKQ